MNDYSSGNQWAQNPYQAQANQTVGLYQAANPSFTDADRAVAGAYADFNNSKYGVDKGFLNQDYDIGMRGIGLNQEGLGIDRGANARDAAYYQNLRNILGQQMGITGETFNNTQQQLQNDAATNVRNINSEYTGRGAWFAPMRGNKVSDTFKNYDTSLQAADLQRRNTLLGQGKEDLGYEKSIAETGDKNKKLDILAKQYGLDAEKLKANLDQGLANLGYSHFTDSLGLIDQLGKGGADVSTIQNIINQALQSGSAYNSGALGNLYNSYFG